MVSDQIKFLVSHRTPRRDIGDIIAQARILDKDGRPIGFIENGDHPQPTPDDWRHSAVIEQFEILALAILAERSGVDVDNFVAKANDELLKLATTRIIPDAESSIRKAIDLMLGSSIRL